MRKLRLFLSMLTLFLFSVGTVLADVGDLYYTFLPYKPSKGAVSDYAQTGTMTIDQLKWTVPGNWYGNEALRLGGKSLDNVDRSIIGQDALGDKIAKIVINHAGKTADAITLNSVKVIKSTNSTFTSGLDTVTVTSGTDFTIAKNTTDSIVITPNGDFWAKDAYYKISFFFSNSNSSNYAFVVNNIKFYSYEEPSSDPSVTMTPASLDFGTPKLNAELAAQTFKLEGANLTDANDVTVTAPTGFSVSIGEAAPAESLTITPSDGAIDETIIVTPSTAAYGVKNGNITIASDDLDPDSTLALTMTVGGAASYTPNPLDLAFGEVLQGDAAANYAKTVTINVTNLTAYKELKIIAPSGFTADPSTIIADENGAITDQEVSLMPVTSNDPGSYPPVAASFVLKCTGAYEFADVELGEPTMTIVAAEAVEVSAITGGTFTWNGGEAPALVKVGATATLVATPTSPYTGGTITVLKADNEKDVTENVMSGSTLTMPDYAIKVVVTFTAPSCTELPAPELGNLSVSYNYANIVWTAVDNAVKYVFNLTEHDGDPYIEDLNTTSLGTEMLNLKVKTQYDYTVMAVGDGDSYCVTSSNLLVGSFTTEDYPAATLTLSENGVERAFAGDHKLNDIVQLPATAENACYGKVFRGWSKNADCAVAPEYAPGADYQIASIADKIYAVYAKENPADPSLDTYKLVSDLTVGKKYIFASSNAAGDAYALPAMAMQADAATSVTGVAITISSVNEVATIETVNADLEYYYEELRAKAGTHTRDTLKMQVVADPTNYLCVNGSGLNKRAWSVNTKVFWNNGLYGTNGSGATVYYVDYKSSNNTFNKGGTTATSRVYAYERTSAAPSYSDYSTTCATPVLQSIELSYDAIDSWKGEDLPKPIVTAKYDIVDDEDVTAVATFSDYDPTHVGDQEITVTYQGKQATYTVTVKTIANDEEHPYSVAEAIALVDAGKDLSTKVYVRGIISSKQFFDNSNTFNVFVKDNLSDEASFEFYKFYSGAGEATFSGEDDLTEKDIIVGYGELTKFNSIYEFKAACYLISRVAYTELAFDAEAGKAYLPAGIQESVLPTLANPSKVTVAYSSSAEAVATVDENGVITPKTAGTTVITASYGGDAYHQPASDTYTLTVYAPEELVITGEPQTEYEYGEEFNMNVLGAKAVYGDNTEYIIPDADIDLESAQPGYVTENGNVEYTIEWEGLSADSTIAVTVKTHTVSFEHPEHGMIVVKNGEDNVVSGDAFVKGTELRVVLVSTNENYKPGELTVTGATLENDSITIGTENVVISATMTEKANPNLQWSESELTVTMDEWDGFVHLNRAEGVDKADIHFTSSNPDAVEIKDGGNLHGDIARWAVGEATLTATYDGNEDYKPGQATCHITVTAGEWKEILFPEMKTAGEWSGETIQAEGSEFSMTIEDLNGTPKIAVEANSAKYGDLENNKQYYHRLKLGGTTSSNRSLTLNIPDNGMLRLAPRSASGTATDRVLTIMQDGEIYNGVVQDADSMWTSEKPGLKVFPYVTVPVKEGIVELYCPAGALNFYAMGYKMNPKHTVTFEKPDNGIIAVQKNEFNVESGVQLTEGTELLVAALPEENHYDYKLNELTINEVPVEGSVAIYTIGTQDVVIAASFVEKDAAPISWPEAEINVTFGDDFESPVLTNEQGLSVAYSIIDEEGAVELDDATGEVYWIKKAGTVVVTATYTSTMEGAYKTTSTSYTLNVSEPQPYYMKGDWNEAGWTWKPMTYAGDGIYVLQDVVFGGSGVNYNTLDSDQGAQWRPVNQTEENHIILDDGEIAAKDTVTFVLIPNTGEVHATNVHKYVAPAETKFYIAGSMTDWEANMIAVTEDSYTFHNLPAGNHQMKVVDGDNWIGYESVKPTDGLYTDEWGNVDFTLADAGTVTVTYIAGETFTVEGTFGKPESKLIGLKGWTEETDAILMENAAADYETASATVTIETADDYEFKLIFNGMWLGKNYNGESEQVVISRENASVDALVSAGKDINFVYTEPYALKLNADMAGEYTFTWNYVTRTLTITYPELPAVKYYLAGSFGEENAWVNYEMAEDEGVWSYALTLDAKSTYQFKIFRRQLSDVWFGAEGEGYSMVYGNSTGWDLASPGENIGLQTTTNASYTFTFDPVNLKMSVDIPEAPTGIDGIDADEKAVKVIHNDMIYIIKGGKTYNITGQLVK